MNTDTKRDSRCSRFEKHKVVVLLSVVVAIIFLSRLFIEKILEIKDNREGISELYWVYKRNIRLREHMPLTDTMVTPSKLRSTQYKGLAVKKYRYRVDEEGYIIPSRIHPDPDIKIVFLGGSTTECLFVDEDKRFPYLAGRFLETALGEKVNSYNAGKSANHTMHCLNILINKIIPLKPDAVILMENINDLFILSQEGSYWNNHPYRSLLIEEESFSPLSPKVLALRYFPHTYYRVAPFKAAIVNFFQRKPAVGANLALTQNSSAFDSKKAEEQFRSSLETFVKVAQQWKISVVLMTQANRFKEKSDVLYNGKIEYQEYKKIYDRFNAIIREVAKANNCLLIDLAKLVPQAEEYMFDDVHFSDYGSEYAAKIISQELGKLLSNQKTSFISP